MMKINKTQISLIVLVSVILIGILIVMNFRDSLENDISYETAVFENAIIKIDTLDTSKDKQTFKVVVENTSNDTLSINDYSFKIESDGNTYSSELLTPTDYRVNPNMDTTIEIEFKMPLSAIEENEAKLIISSFYFSQEQAIPLNN